MLVTLAANKISGTIVLERLMEAKDKETSWKIFLQFLLVFYNCTVTIYYIWYNNCNEIIYFSYFWANHHWFHCSSFFVEFILQYSRQFCDCWIQYNQLLLINFSNSRETIILIHIILCSGLSVRIIFPE